MKTSLLLVAFASWMTLPGDEEDAVRDIEKLGGTVAP